MIQITVKIYILTHLNSLIYLNITVLMLYLPLCIINFLYLITKKYLQGLQI